MEISAIDGQMLKNMIIAGANKLNENKERIDSLNVFPVPDGDTGTNMSLTAMAAVKELEALETGDVYAVAKAASAGSLRGARGNSGVILSQLFRGFAKGLENCQVMGIEEAAAALTQSAETAYKAVMKPKEGTILTIAREISERAALLVFETRDIMKFFEEILIYGNEVLKKTTDMLPALKQANVVDAGGQGLLIFLQGAFEGTANKEIKMPALLKTEASKVDFSALAAISHEDITFGYCTEFFINVKKVEEAAEESLKAYLEAIGDSIVVVGDDTILKIHVHTDNPGAVLEKALTYGYLSNIKIENMRMQHSDALGLWENGGTEFSVGQTEKKEIGFVAVASGQGFTDVFMELGADRVIEGGQTMNPSAEDIAEAVNGVNAENVIVLPNNKNIVLAARQAAYLCDGRKVIVVPSETVPQGITAMLSYVAGEGAEEAAVRMENSLSTVKTGQLTYSVKDTVLDGFEIKEGDVLCLLDGKIVHVSKDVQEGAKALLDVMLDKNSEVVSLFYGQGADEAMAEEISGYVTEKREDCDVEVRYGGQPVYSYVFAVE